MEVSVPALVRDRISRREAAKLFSLLGLIMVLAPGVAPSSAARFGTAGTMSVCRCGCPGP